MPSGCQVPRRQDTKILNKNKCPSLALDKDLRSERSTTVRFDRNQPLPPVAMKWSMSKHRYFRKRAGHERIPALPASNDNDNLKFDEGSGQMFTETFVRAQSSADRNWSRLLRPRSIITSDAQNNKRRIRGSRALRDLAIDSIVENLGDLTFEWIQELPKHLKLRIWALARERYTVPLTVWSMFSRDLSREDRIPLSLLRYRQQIELPPLSLGSYSTAITSPGFDFLATLSITTAFPVSDLVTLSSITNLAVLEIIHTTGQVMESPVSDRLLRTWQEAAINKGAFPVLRILKLWNHNELTSNSILYLNSFPILALCDIRGCNLGADARAKAQSLGWKTSLDPSTLALYEAACVERAVRLRIIADGHNIEPIRRAPSQQLDDSKTISRLPRNEVAAFLTNPSRSLRQPKPSRAAQRWSEIQMAIDSLVEHVESPPVSGPWEFGDFNRDQMARRRPTYVKQKWDFDLCTIFSRIGELRSDRDLSRAGLDIGDQAVADDELVNSIPMASLRLGHSPSYLLSSRMNNQIKSLYGTPKVARKKPQPAPDIQDITFIRIKAPRAEDQRSPTVEDEVVEELDDNALKRSTSAMSTVKQRSTKFLQNKKMKLGDILGSFI
ncbi:CBS domain-containing protein [Drepanopeziza brunnea f. sp. 'multigermtubi' MB_m1]|uniref:CBS domain-containing protein n=1 Tax=Marssonina brunnea f. sp. multigermtubi (strain MB_m1) TaxID=1072389 RepID=K1WMY4_MARBU|nr:CBS domain-containing protein [Drepanopeziza brunnea f. sp. 'multigermtubi' MB_m1]EKD14216.1 CBS domain-containing protein [Drepanopeziza brunnea f. sp. 'multigermtubi' MB_m1]